MAILKITIDKSMQNIKQEIITSDKEPDFSLLAQILAKQFLRDMKKKERSTVIWI